MRVLVACCLVGGTLVVGALGGQGQGHGENSVIGYAAETRTGGQVGVGGERRHGNGEGGQGFNPGQGGHGGGQEGGHEGGHLEVRGTSDMTLQEEVSF